MVNIRQLSDHIFLEIGTINQGGRKVISDGGSLVIRKMVFFKKYQILILLVHKIQKDGGP